LNAPVYRMDQYNLTVMYVPPIRGSDMRVWNAEIPANCSVLVQTPVSGLPVYLY
jgi:hypothetical protein